MNLKTYLNNPCGSSSLPYYKTNTYQFPKGVQVTHGYEIQVGSQSYFRLIHTLDCIDDVIVPDGYFLRIIDTHNPNEIERLRLFVNSCYQDISLKSNQIQSMINSPLFDPHLWIIIEDKDGKIVASGISEHDRQVPEGILEWIQVDIRHRGMGFGKAIVNATLHYFQTHVPFVTVSGECFNQTKPDQLYRKCGFEGNDIWTVEITETKTL